MQMQKGYEWLNDVGVLPKLVQEGLKLVGIVEVPGSKNSPTIMGWAKETGLQTTYTADSVPWCGLFAAVVAKRASKEIPKNPLWALNWGNFGTKGMQPCLGDILTFVRDGGGHVGIYIGEDQFAYHVLGGNQSDAVNIKRIDKKRLRHVRRPHVITAHAASAKPYILQIAGPMSRNEQ